MRTEGLVKAKGVTLKGKGRLAAWPWRSRTRSIRAIGHRCRGCALGPAVVSGSGP
jgi:hypothetical protein